MAKRFITDTNYAGVRTIIMKMKTEGLSNVEIGKHVGISDVTVGRITRSKVYEQYQAECARGHDADPVIDVDDIIQELQGCLQSFEDAKAQLTTKQEAIRNTIAHLQMAEVDA